MMNLEELTVVMEITSEGVKSALNSHCSIFDTPCKIDVLRATFCLAPVPSGASPTTSTLSSILSAIPLAEFQLVLSSKSEM